MLTQRQRSLRLGALVLFACLAAATIPLKAADPAGEIAQTVSGGDPSLVEAATSVDQPPSSPPAPAPSTPPAPSGTPAFARSQNVTINLINRLVERGVLTKQDATELIHMAEEDAAAARAEEAAAAQATPPPPPEEDAVRVTYVPEV